MRTIPVGISVSAIKILAAAALVIGSASNSRAQTFNLLSAFPGGTNSAQPVSSLVLGTNGNLYGTTLSGGASGKGTLFMATPAGKITPLFSFAGSNGSQPYASLLLGTNGNFYGTTAHGGDFNQGTVFVITPAGSLTSLASFNGTNGAQPYGALIQGTDGNLYGTTSTGGNFGLGTVFSVSPGGTLTSLASFDGTNGSQPFAALTLLGSNGTYFGTASSGGTFNTGTVFSFRPGTNNALVAVHSFSAGTDGAAPKGALLSATDGNLYGTTAGGGTNGLGTAFRLTTGFGSNATFTVLYSFDGTNGSSPYATLFEGDDTNLYGSTISGGLSGHGTLFALGLSGSFTNLYSFLNGNDGGNPYFAGLVAGTNGDLFGVASTAGSHGAGTLFQITGFPPIVLAGPTNQTVPKGATVSFTVTAAGSPPLTYRWQLNSNNLANTARITGVTTPTLTITNVSTKDAGVYSVVIQNSAGAISNASAILLVANPPTLTITQPGKNAVIKTPFVNVQGTTSDNVVVSQVYVQLNGGNWQLATPVSGWSRWSLNNQELTPGTNVVSAYAVNVVGLSSTTNTNTFVYSTGAWRLTVSTNGPGSTSPNYNGRLLNISQSYKITALPAKGYVVSNWTAIIDSTNLVLTDMPVLTFAMQSNMALQVTFVPTPFIPVSGSYNGLFFVSTNVAQDSSGFFKLRVESTGVFSGSIQIGNQHYSMSGRCHLDGSAQATVSRGSKLEPLQLAFQLDLAGGTGALTGTVTTSSWEAQLTADLAVFDGKTQIAPQLGAYTLSIAGSEDSTNQPGGNSYATVTIDKAGHVHLSGALADGTKFGASTVISTNGLSPVYVPLYGGNGSLLSWLSVSNAGAATLSGDVSWIKPAIKSAKFYPLGFTVGTSLTGSRYVAPASGQGILTSTNALLILSGGALDQPLTNSISLGPNGRVVNQQAGVNLTLSFTPGTGLFHGHIAGPGVPGTVPLNGVALQEENSALGYFLGTTQSGAVVITGQ